jgi:hypothetical protein
MLWAGVEKNTGTFGLLMAVASLGLIFQHCGAKKPPCKTPVDFAFEKGQQRFNKFRKFTFSYQ